MSLSHWETGQIQGSGRPMVNCLPSGSPVQRLPSHRPSSGLQHPHVVGVTANVPWALFQWHQGITPALPPWPLHPMSRSLLGVTPLLQGLPVPGHHKGSFPCKSSPAVTVTVSVNETLLFTLAMRPLTLPSHGLQKAGVWAIGEETGFWEFSEYGLKNSREVMVARCAFLGYAIKSPLVNVT